MDRRHAEEPDEHQPTTGLHPSVAVWGYFASMVFWSFGSWMFAIVTWYDGVSGLLATVQPLLYAISGILWGSQFWLFTTNWRGRAKRQWEKPTWGNRHPMGYARPQSRFIQAAARFLTPPVILADLLVISLVLIR